MSLLVSVCFCALFTLTTSIIETITNPGQNVTVTCGKDNDCTIHCDQKDSCVGSTFNVEYGNINILCTGEYSCRDVHILSSHTLSLNMAFGSGSFTGHYWGYRDKNVTVYCDGTWGCNEATFHYDSIAPVKHECNHWFACSDTTIHAVTETNILCADADSSCYHMSVISATNNYTIKVIGTQYAYSTEPIHIFPTSEIRIYELLICEECELDAIIYVPAMDLDRSKSCLASDASCISDMINRLYKEPYTVIDNYYNPDYPSSITGDALLIHSKRPGITPSELTAPDMPGSNDEFQVFCIECSGITFDFASTQSAIIRYFWKTSNEWMSGSTIYGPSHAFQLISHVGFLYNENNKVHVNNTAVIYIQDVGYNSDIFLGGALDVDIVCSGERSCKDVDIYSDINPDSYSLFGSDGIWNISCYGSDACDPYIYLHFSYLNKQCLYTATGPDTAACPFLKESSTETDTGKQRQKVSAFQWVLYITVAVVVGVAVGWYVYKENENMTHVLIFCCCYWVLYIVSMLIWWFLIL